MNLPRAAGRLLRGRSIRGVLISLLLPGIVLLLMIDSWHDYRTLAEVSKEAYDNALVEPARVLESSLEMDPDGRLRLAAPLYAQAMLESQAGLRRYFSVEFFNPPSSRLEDMLLQRGEPLSGLTDLPRPPTPVSLTGEPLFFDADYRGEPVRVVAVAREIFRAGQRRQVVLTIAESVGRRDEVEIVARQSEIARDVRMLALVTVLVWLGVAWAMGPLNRLRTSVRARLEDDLTPLDAGDVPVEVAPLVDAINYHVGRHRKVLQEQTEFLADASHQLRTPLAIMLTQAQYALREKDADRAHEALAAVVEQLRQTRRLTEQLLALAHARQQDAVPRVRCEVRSLAKQVLLRYWPLAREKAQDLGLDATGEEAPLWVRANEAEIHEALSNLVHNAIHYCPAGATVTVSIRQTDTCAELWVIDNGPGVAHKDRDRVFERFERAGSSVVGAGSAKPAGSGLGLAIARAYARRNGGDIVLRNGEPHASGVGLASVLSVPLDGE